jgi:Leucine-rich repeat (LRR) protein
MSRGVVEDVTPRALAVLSDDELAAVAQPERVQRLLLQGPEVTSLQGIERFVAVRQLVLSNAGGTDLSPLERLPRLETLIIDHPQVRDAPDRGWREPVDEALDYSSLARLTGLKRLYLRVIDYANAAALAEVRLGDLRELEVLHHCYVPAELSLRGRASDPSVDPRLGLPEVDYSWLEDLPALHEFILWGFRPVGSGGAEVIAESRRTAKFGLAFPMPQRREVRGKRDDLRSVKDAAMLTALELSGRGIRSLYGIDRFTSLRQLTLNRLRDIDMAPLESLTELTFLAVHKTRAAVDFSPLAHLASLEDVHLESADDATDQAIAALDFSHLARLWSLSLEASSPGARMPVDLDWVATHSRLRVLYLYGFWPRGRSLEGFYDLTVNVDRVFILTTDPEDFARLLQSRPPSNVTVDTLRVSESGPEILEVDGQLFIAADLASSRGFETNYDAAERLDAFLKRTAPDVASRLQWDTEAGEVVVLSDDEAALQHVRKVLRADKW